MQQARELHLRVDSVGNLAFRPLQESFGVASGRVFGARRNIIVRTFSRPRSSRSSRDRSNPRYLQDVSKVRRTNSWPRPRRSRRHRRNPIQAGIVNYRQGVRSITRECDATRRQNAYSVITPRSGIDRNYTGAYPMPQIRSRFAAAQVEILPEVHHLQRCQRPGKFVVVARPVPDRRDPVVEPFLLECEQEFAFDPSRCHGVGSQNDHQPIAAVQRRPDLVVPLPSRPGCWCRCTTPECRVRGSPRQVWP